MSGFQFLFQQAGQAMAGTVGEQAAARAGRLIPGVGWAVSGVTLAREYATYEREQARDRARQVLRCDHIEVCPEVPFATATATMMACAREQHGVAFPFEGFTLCHPQPDLDTRRLSPVAWRWNGRGATRGTGGRHLRPCRVCSAIRELAPGASGR